MLTNFESVLASTFAEIATGGELRESFARSSRLHRDPAHEQRVAERRAELERLPVAELIERAHAHHIRDELAPEVLVEVVARHEVAHEVIAAEDDAEVDRWQARQRALFGTEIDE